MTTTAEILRGAKAVIQRNGWTQREYFDEKQHEDGTPVTECRVDLRGALNLAAGSPSPAEQPDAGVDAHIVLWNAIRADGFSGGPIKWNDTPGRTEAEVLALLDRAIEVAEGGDAR